MREILHIEGRATRSIPPPAQPQKHQAVDSRKELESSEYRKPILPAVLASFVFHLALLIVLSLIVYGGGSSNLSLEFEMVEAAPTAVDDLAAFELEAEPIPEVEETVEFVPDFKMTVDLSLPELPVAEPTQEVVVPPAEEAITVASTTPVSTTLAQPLSKAAMSIQKRVNEAGGKKGEVQFALAWKNVNDVDLHVIVPSGERISHMYKSSRCGGVLDVDMNVRGESSTPVENIRWLSNAPAGRYSVLVNLFRVHRPRAGERVYRGSDFQLLAQLGEESLIEDDIVNSRQQVAVFRFIYLPKHVEGPEREAAIKRIEKKSKEEEVAAVRLLDKAKDTTKQQLRDRLLNNLINMYPHSDAAIDAMRLLGGRVSKNGF